MLIFSFRTFERYFVKAVFFSKNPDFLALGFFLVLGLAGWSCQPIRSCWLVLPAD
jgi:hypothetical protein